MQPGVLDAYVRARINFTDIRNHSMGTMQGTDLATLPVKQLLEEAHRRGVLVYGTVPAKWIGKGEGDSLGAARKLFEEFADA